MEIAVKWVWQEVKDKKGIPTEAGQKPCLCFRGHKYMLGVAAGHPVRVLKRPVKDFDILRAVIFKGKIYTTEHAVAQLEEIALRNGITEKARRLLERAKEKRDSDTIDEEEFQDEEGVTMEKPVDATTQGSVNNDPAATNTGESSPKETEVAGKKNGGKKKGSKKAASKSTGRKAAAAPTQAQSAEIIRKVKAALEKSKEAHKGKLPKGAKRKIYTEVGEEVGGFKRRVVRALMNAGKDKKK